MGLELTEAEAALALGGLQSGASELRSIVRLINISAEASAACFHFSSTDLRAAFQQKGGDSKKGHEKASQQGLNHFYRTTNQDLLKIWQFLEVKSNFCFVFFKSHGRLDLEKSTGHFDEEIKQVVNECYVKAKGRYERLKGLVIPVCNPPPIAHISI